MGADSHGNAAVCGNHVPEDSGRAVLGHAAPDDGHAASNGRTAPDGSVAPLADGVSLEVYHGGTRVFSSQAKWLYPLFELEEFLETSGLKGENLFLHDRIAGRAAAALISRMGFRSCFIDTVSRLALARFQRAAVDCGYHKLVDKILCKTEDLIHKGMGQDEVYALLKKRAGLIHGVDLEVSGLRVAYSGKPVLDGLNLSLKGGSTLVITGDNGSGKSTLLKTLMGVLKPSAGTIHLGKSAQPGAPGAHIAYVNQNIADSPFPLTAREVVASACAGRRLRRDERRYEVEIAMRRTGCFALAERNFYHLSGGERQRVSLARCLCQKAGLILLDEPTSFLDTDARDEFLRVLTQVTRRQLPTVILVSHDHEWIARLGWPVKELKGGRLC